MSAEGSPQKKPFLKDQFPFFVGAWSAAGYVTGFAATVATIPISIVTIPLAVNSNKERAARGEEGVGIFPLTQIVAENMKKVGQVLNTLAIFGAAMYGMADMALHNPPQRTIVEPTPLIWDSGIPYTATPLPTAMVPPTATSMPTTNADCVFIGNGIGTASSAWKNLGKPPQVIFKNLAGPDADGSSTTLSPGALPRVVHNGDAFCPVR